jgi:hypothetical protein
MITAGTRGHDQYPDRRLHQNSTPNTRRSSKWSGRKSLALVSRWQLLLVCDQRVSQKAHATSSRTRNVSCCSKGLKYLVNLVVPRGPWIRTNVG